MNPTKGYRLEYLKFCLYIEFFLEVVVFYYIEIGKIYLQTNLNLMRTINDNLTQKLNDFI